MSDQGLIQANKPLRIVIVAGELSGDILGAGLIRELKKLHPTAEFFGIGGPRMQEEGFVSHWPMDRLSVMGFVEVFGRLRELLNLRKEVRDFCLQEKPDLFVGIDAPDFNLTLEGWVHDAGIPVAHYVSPSVWAWKQGRLKKIARCVDHMLTLLPFEADFYHRRNIPVTFVGHPLADELPMDVDQNACRDQLGLSKEHSVLAVLPGSRSSEVKYLGQTFIDTALRCCEVMPELQVAIPCANALRRQQIEDQLAVVKPELRQCFHLFDGMSREVMSASDAVLLASGTAALEAMLLKKPMVVAYKMAWLSHAIISRMIKVDHISLPNLIAGEALVPEMIQDKATVGSLSDLLLDRLQNPDNYRGLVERFYQLHHKLKREASQVAAKTLSELMAQQAHSDTSAEHKH
ncbi:lipid-A-disaccharide synthase [Oceanospirillum linum]|uniref:Lipid-A-disaccharide synthase n=1 Tax=Oceanospirillum linum TaxID=966 RepID=A0A1T1HFK8_OCELI|nr:lipid-A-disaccharide synthase [Oceanospirillum linum]OOV88633.1 lipid-A-disaccharide synthase [Oceanospirillum linum]SEG04706.1 lipid-A-disaccharide synthase [Oleiphilus messinensis]SMP20908.1 lipid-A-disaccharide synthase [Oceanospirillum linum]